MWKKTIGLALIALLYAHFTKAKAPAINHVPQNDSNPVFTFVEQMPEFPGGEIAIQRYLADSIRYPAEAIQQQLQGAVYVRFIVSKTGHLKDIKVLRSPGKLLSDEAIRVLQNMPPFKPGKQNGQNVDVYFTLPVRFSLK